MGYSQLFFAFINSNYFKVFKGPHPQTLPCFAYRVDSYVHVEWQWIILFSLTLYPFLPSVLLYFLWCSLPWELYAK